MARAVSPLPQALAPTPSAGAYKCLANYRVNLELLSTVGNVCSAAECAARCTNGTFASPATGDAARCTAFLHSQGRCRCQLGRAPLHGPDEAVGVHSGAGFVACMRGDADFLRLGALNDPSMVQLTLGERVLTLHPEPLRYDAAATVCRTQLPSNGTLASADTLVEALAAASRLLLALPPRLLVPQPGVPPGMFGAWVGLAVNGSRLLALLDNVPGATTQGLAWDDGAAVNRTLLQVRCSFSFLTAAAAAHPPSAQALLTRGTGAPRRENARHGAHTCWRLPFYWCRADAVGRGAQRHALVRARPAGAAHLRALFKLDRAAAPGPGGGRQLRLGAALHLRM